MSLFKPCILIPVYNHEQPLPGLLERVAGFGLHCFLIDDGSHETCAAVIRQLADEHDWISTQRLPQNRGKGGAVKSGLRLAQQHGYSHAVQIDADGQHDVGDLEQFLATARAHPEAVIIGRPLFDHSIPRLRFYARYLTHLWVYINTLSLAIHDAMCGYRVYPLASSCQLINSTTLEERMAFDVEILVRLYWQGLEMVAIPTKVGYPEDGISHFLGVEDNLRISLTHARLFFGMLIRWPGLLARHFR